MKKSKKTIDTLVQDCEELFTKNTELSDELLDWAAQEFRAVLKKRFAHYGDSPKEENLRMSQVGKELRLLYLENKDNDPKDFPPNVKRIFLYGDIIEILLLLMAKASGHTVTHEQHEVHLNGVTGHIDCIIDDHLVDIKSTSGRAFEKFARGSIKTGDDPYGYIGQLAGYGQSEELKDLVEDRLAFFVMEKEMGHLTTLKVPKMYTPNMTHKINHIRKHIKEDVLPPKLRVSEPRPQTKLSNNKKIGSSCTFCKFKWECWPGLRAFKYSNRVDYLCHVEKEPRVEEITHELFDKRTKFNRKKSRSPSKSN